MLKSERRWLSYRKKLKKETQYEAELIEARVEQLYQEGEPITSELIGTLVKGVHGVTTAYMADYLLDKYRRKTYYESIERDTNK